MKVGVLGGGQLARMLALAGYPLGITVIAYDAQADACAGQVTELMTGSYDNEAALQLFAEKVDVITYETENIPVTTANFVKQWRPIYPDVKALTVAQDRLFEKNLFKELGIATPAYATIDSLAELEKAITAIGMPAVLKTRRFGYDGKGQYVIRNKTQLSEAWEQLGKEQLLLEGFIKFDREASMIATRDLKGNIQYYPLTENLHQAGILRCSTAPYLDEGLTTKAQIYANKILTHLNYVGTLAIEFFVLGEQLLANEMAPRVHNSGHWTIEGADTSQFENHLRAILSLPLGSTKARGHVAMINFISTEPTLAATLTLPQVHFHTYGKEPRANRKLGHATLLSNDITSFQQQLSALKKLI